jgi:tRNA-dihydrouridine synthase
MGLDYVEPDAPARLAIALDHFRDSLSFYGDRLGLRIFRKHLAAYVDNAPWPMQAEARRTARQALCRLEDPAEVERSLIALWSDPSPERMAA